MDSLTDTEIREILEKARTIAVVGASNKETKPSHTIPLFMQRLGFTIIPVNPNSREVFGLTCYPSLLEVPVHVDIVDVFRPGSDAPELARQAATIGADVFWLQLGITSEEAKKIAEEAHMQFLEDRCIGPTTRALGVSHVAGTV